MKKNIFQWEIGLFFYDLLFILLSFLLLPSYILKRKFRLKVGKEKLFFLSPWLRERLGRVRRALWIQAVSVGEIILSRALVHRLRALSDYEIVISTTTLTGYSVARRLYHPHCVVLFFPFDLSFVINKAIKWIKPAVFIPIETEIWPNLFYRLYKRDVPIIILNGRISQKSFRWYKKITFFMKKLFAMCKYIGVQDAFSKERFLSLGAREDKLVITGNMKFSSVGIEENALIEFKRKYATKLKKDEEILLLAASTHEPEEQILLRIYKELLSLYPFLRLLLAPRDLYRLPLVEKIIEKEGLSFLHLSKLNSYFPSGVYLLDTVGELFYFYSLCDISFVGGSLTNWGGHNILEPAYFKKPIIFGPYMNNFKEIRDIFLAHDAAIEVKNKEELKSTIIRLLEDKELKGKISFNAFSLLSKGRQYLEESVRLVLACLG